MSRPLPLLPAHHLAGMLRAREISAAELMEETIARAEATEPLINAFCWTRFEEALEEAKEAEVRFSATSLDPRPLEGIPVAIKDETGIEGQPLTESSLLHAERIATATDPAVQRIIDAGGIVLAHASEPEFGLAPYTHSHLHGLTRNPWNPEFSPGGSSGGSAAALAAGTTVLANGNDIGGSIRIPSSCCGTVGLKPTYGRIPALPPWNLDTFLHSGPMARNVEDCRRLYNIMVGPHPVDEVSIHPAEEVAVLPAGGEVRVAICPSPGDYRVDPEISGAVVAAGDRLSEAGVEVVEIELDWSHQAFAEALLVHVGTFVQPAFALESRGREEELTEYVRQVLGMSAEALNELGARQPIELQAATYAELAPHFESFDSIILPTLALPAFRAGDEHEGNGDPLGAGSGHWLESLITIPFNLCSRIPVIDVPIGVSRDGVPIGAQIAAPPYSEAVAFRTALAVEATVPFPGREGSFPDLISQTKENAVE